MKRSLFNIFLLVSVSAYAQKQVKTIVVPSRTRLFDSDWLFKKDSTINAQGPAYNDSGWRVVELPHDWSIEDLPNQIPDSIRGPFSKAATGKMSTGFTVGGTGWYRKKFITGKAELGKQVTICFDGVYMNSDVWLNGHHLGNHPYGYTAFYYDLTPYLMPAGRQNVVAVRVKNEGRNSRWYSGSGIYRHVWLSVTEPVHIAPWGVYITTQISGNSAIVTLKTKLDNNWSTKSGISLVSTIFSPEGKAVGSNTNDLILDAGAVKEQKQVISLSNPALWSIETPRLYKVMTEIKQAGKTIDKVETFFGIRSIKFDAASGFSINGKKVLLKGGCIHHDNGPLGSAVINRAEERKIEILKKNGFNAIRTSHNPPSQQLLDACDRIGMLVIDEAFDMWEKAKNPDDYHLYFKDWWQKDLDAMVFRDRNHPSIILWSIGNEIGEKADTSGLRIAKKLADRIHYLDPTRPVTEAICSFWENPSRKWEETAPAFALLDVGGYNYQWREYEKDHQQFPERIMIGTESFPREALENWNMVKQHPYVIGDFVWTAFDYLGEASIGQTKLDSINAPGFKYSVGWPWYNAWCGDMDITGEKKAQSYYRDIVWNRAAIAMAVHKPIPVGLKELVSLWGWPDESQSWTWPGAAGKSLQVRVFSRAPLVRLMLNGKVIGEQKMAADSITAVFQVPYQPGILKAVNVINGKETDAVELKTAGLPNRVRLIADRTNINADRNDLSYVKIEITDKNGQVVPDAEIRVRISISGEGEIAGVASASPVDMASFQYPERKTFNGRCLAIVRPKGRSGKIILKVSAESLTPAELVIETR